MPLEPSAVIADIARSAARLGKQRCVLAYSGGLDSSVLLDILHGHVRMPLRAIYVDHGLQGAQPQWLAHVQSQCAARAVPLEIITLKLAPAAGDSVEAVARDARYAALAKSLQADELLLLAQHRDDQAETLMLQLLRGAGPAGLAAMPATAPIGAGVLMRPLLALPRSDLVSYAETQAVAWFDDPSNADLRFDRNYLRHAVMPRIRERWPGADKTLGRAAALQAQAQRVLTQQAAADARHVRLSAARLSVSQLRQLDANRQANVVRFCLAASGFALPPASRVLSVLQLCAGDSGRGEVRWPGASVRRYRDGLYLMHPLDAAPDESTELQFSGEVSLELPGELGRLSITAAGGLRPSALRCRFRRGGERVREAPGRPSMSLAQWFQNNDVPPWERSRTPMLFAGDALVAIGEHTLSGFCEQADGLQVRWQRRDRPSGPPDG